MAPDNSSTSPAPDPSRYRVRRVFGCLLQVLGVVFIVVLLGIVAAALAFQGWSVRDTRKPDAAASLAVDIQKGDSLRTVADRLEQARVARPAPLVMALALARKIDRRLLPGRYAFQPGTPPRLVLDRLTRGPDIPTARVTIPEGWQLKRIAERLAAQGAIRDAARFVALCHDPAVLQGFGITSSSAEGMLFPDTYRFEQPTGEQEVLHRMIVRFDEVIDSLRLRPGMNSPHAFGLTFAQSLTLASIIEREARDPAEMPLISSVYHNRLRRGMRLDSCATVRFALDKWNGPLTLSDLKTDSAYNTYVHSGLPPGPICNPGRAAIDAAFRPVASDYLYYVYRGEGHHAFSKTLREHEALRRKYRDLWQFSARENGTAESAAESALPANAGAKP